MSLLKVLVVDDEESMQGVCSEILSSAGYEIKLASNGKEALGRLGEGWDLVLTDVNMPELGGVAFYEAAIGMDRGLKDRFLFMTGDMKAMEAVSSMNTNFIRKPFRVKDLLCAVESAIKNAEANNRLEPRLRLCGCGVLVEASGALRINAASENISRSGMRIKYEGVQLEPGWTLDVRLSPLCLSLVKQARVVWSSRVQGHEFTSGLLFNVPVPDSLIAELAMHGDVG